MRYIVFTGGILLFCCCMNSSSVPQGVISDHRFQITDTFTTITKNIDTVSNKDHIASGIVKPNQDKKSSRYNKDQKSDHVTIASQKTTTFEQWFHQGFVGLMKFFGYAAVVLIVLLLFWYICYFFVYKNIRKIHQSKSAIGVPKRKQNKDIVIRIPQEDLDTITKSMPYGGKVQVGISIDINPPPSTL